MNAANVKRSISVSVRSCVDHAAILQLLQLGVGLQRPIQDECGMLAGTVLVNSAGICVQFHTPDARVWRISFDDLVQAVAEAASEQRSVSKEREPSKKSATFWRRIRAAWAACFYFAKEKL